MALHEIDSFVSKFKALCQGGRHASLTLSSKAGKAVVNLRVDLGDVSQDPHLHHPPQKPSRNGPAQQRRRERRAAVRQAAAEEAEAALSLVEIEVLEMADTAKNKKVAEQAKVATKAKDDTEKVSVIKVLKKKVDEIPDEVVPDSEYGSMAPSKDEPQTESNPVEEPPPRLRDRSLGGIDYYTLSYDDPIFKNGYN
jgi:hypothetical protein